MKLVINQMRKESFIYFTAKAPKINTVLQGSGFHSLNLSADRQAYLLRLSYSLANPADSIRDL
jgi:hypothetical protein